jgi:hypothetical protein
VQDHGYVVCCQFKPNLDAKDAQKVLSPYKDVIDTKKLSTMLCAERTPMYGNKENKEIAEKRSSSGLALTQLNGRWLSTKHTFSPWI